MKKIIKLLVIAICMIQAYVSGCSGRNKEDMPFNKVGWNHSNSMGQYKYRDAMLTDLLKNYHLKGRMLSELRGIFGTVPLDTSAGKPVVYFEIVTEYDGIDPSFQKNMVLKLNSDSIVTDVKVYSHRSD